MTTIIHSQQWDKISQTKTADRHRAGISRKQNSDQLSKMRVMKEYIIYITIILNVIIYYIFYIIFHYIYTNICSCCKIVEEILTECIYSLAVKSSLEATKLKDKKENTDQLEYIKRQTFGRKKDTTTEVKQQSIHWEKIF